MLASASEQCFPSTKKTACTAPVSKGDSRHQQQGLGVAIQELLHWFCVIVHGQWLGDQLGGNRQSPVHANPLGQYTAPKGKATYMLTTANMYVCVLVSARLYQGFPFRILTCRVGR